MVLYCISFSSISFEINVKGQLCLSVMKLLFSSISMLRTYRPMSTRIAHTIHSELQKFSSVAIIKTASISVCTIQYSSHLYKSTDLQIHARATETERKKTSHERARFQLTFNTQHTQTNVYIFYTFVIVVVGWSCAGPYSKLDKIVQQMRYHTPVSESQIANITHITKNPIETKKNRPFDRS